MRTAEETDESIILVEYDYQCCADIKNKLLCRKCNKEYLPSNFNSHVCTSPNTLNRFLEDEYNMDKIDADYS